MINEIIAAVVPSVNLVSLVLLLLLQYNGG